MSRSQLALSKIKLEQLLAGVRYQASIPLDLPVRGLCSDSRQVTSGQVFACLEQGERGAGYIAQAQSKGAAATLADQATELKDGVDVRVKHLGASLSSIAGNLYAHPSRQLSVVGVTGTNGKSTVCSWIEQLLEMNGMPAASIGTLGVHACGEQLVDADGMTTRDAIRAQEVLKFCRDAGAETVAMEVSSHGMHQHRVEAICFAVALFTNFSRDHLDYHQSEREYWKAKKRLFALPGIRCAVLNIDDAKGRELADELRGSMEVLCFSLEGRQQADMRLSGLRFDQGYHAELDSKWGTAPLYLPQMTAEFELSNLLASLCATCFLGLDLSLALSRVAELQPARGRMQLVGSLDRKNIKVYVDYAHTPDAVQRVLAALKVAAVEAGGHLIAVLGCGGDRDTGKRPQMASAALDSADHLIITSDNPRSEDPALIEQDMLRGVKDLTSVSCIRDRKQAIKQALDMAPLNSCIAVLGKGHEGGQIFADRTEPFSDIEVVKDLLIELQNSGEANQ